MNWDVFKWILAIFNNFESFLKEGRKFPYFLFLTSDIWNFAEFVKKTIPTYRPIIMRKIIESQPKNNTLNALRLGIIIMKIQRI